VPLKAAREKRDAARQQLAAGIDPGLARRAEKQAQAGAESFEAVAREWHERFAPGWEASSAKCILRRFERDVFPWLGKRPIADLRGALPPTKPKHHASIVDPKGVGQLLRALDGYEGHFVTKCALRLAPLVLVRPGEMRKAEWTEFDLDKSEWHIPAARMKMRVKHIVPLSAQALAILRELEPLTNRPLASRPDAPRGQRGLQLCRASAGATQDDAGLGGLSGRPEVWDGRDSAVSNRLAKLRT